MKPVRCVLMPVSSVLKPVSWNFWLDRCALGYVLPGIGFCSLRTAIEILPQNVCISDIPPIGGTASLEHVSIGRDKAKSRCFSKSKSVCAGGSGKVPRLCAI